MRFWAIYTLVSILVFLALIAFLTREAVRGGYSLYRRFRAPA